MISIKKVEGQELRLLTDTFKEYISLENTDIEHIVAFDGNTPLGFIEILMKNDIVEIINMYVNVHERGQGLGDGILRAALNYAEKSGIKWAIFNGDKNNTFFIKEGFTLLKNTVVPEEIKDSFKSHDPNKTYCCNIQKFFDKGCKK